MHPDVRCDIARPDQLDHVHGRRVAALPALSAFQRGFGTLSGVFGVDLRRATRPRFGAHGGIPGNESAGTGVELLRCVSQLDTLDRAPRRCSDLRLSDVPSSVQDFVERHEEDHRRQLTLRLV
jgi:hypothetical protein